ncbi:MAG: hypothetical protein RR482_06775, partial [Clostridia bacterium]
AAYLQSLQPTPTPLPTPVPFPTRTPLPMPTATPYAPPVTTAPQISGYARTVVQNAPMLSWPNMGASPLMALPFNTVVYVQEQIYPQDSSQWHYINYQGNWGYVLSGYLRMMSPE